MISPLAVISFFIACALFYISPKIGQVTRLMDDPGGRKHHEQSTPLVGGIIILPLFFLALIAAGLWSYYWVLIIAACVIMGMGIIDDRIQLNPYLKFAVQVFVSCFVVIFGHVEVEILGNLFGLGEINLGWFAKPFSVMCLVLFVNAANMIDGLDGLHGGLMAAMMFVLSLAAFFAGKGGQVAVLSLILAPLLAFLIFNMRYPGHKKASVFMGDAGSLTMGLIIGWFAIQFSQYPLNIISPSVVPWIVGLPVADALGIYLYRTLNGKHPFSPDRNHIHHRFVDNGVSVGKTTLILCGVTLVLALFALGLEALNIHDAIIFCVWLGLFFAHIALMFHPQKLIGAIQRFA